MSGITNLVNKMADAWEEGYDKTPQRAIQSVMMMVIATGLFAAGIGIAAAVLQSNALDLYRSILSNYSWQIGLTASAALLAGYLFRRITHPAVTGFEDIGPTTFDRFKEAVFVTLVVYSLFALGLGISSWAENVEFPKYAATLFGNHTFTLLTTTGAGLLIGYLFYRTIHQGYSRKESIDNLLTKED